MKFCCGFFEGMFTNAGRSGFAIFARSNPRGPTFVLQTRSFSIVETVPAEHSGLLAEEGYIGYCPGCGVELTRYYRKRISDLLRDDLTFPDS